MNCLILIIYFFLNVNVLVIGDSITAANNNYVDILNKQSGYTFTKLGYVGESSTEIKKHLFWLNLNNFNQIIIETGINNLDNPNVVIRDITEMATHIKKQNQNIKIIVLTIPPYKGYSTWSETKQKNLEIINNWILTNNQFTGVDIYTPLSNKNYSKYSTDKLHPNKKGHEIMALEILKFL